MFVYSQLLWLVSTVIFLDATAPNSNQKEASKDICIQSIEIEEMCEKYRNVGKQRNEFEVKLAQQDSVNSSNPNVVPLNVFRRQSTDPKVRAKELQQLQFLEITNELSKKCNLTREQADEVLSDIQMDGPKCRTVIQDCQEDSFSGVCDRYSRYRTQDGTCNNLLNPTWGSSGVCFQRILPAVYVGSSGFRQSVLGGPLPEPRDLSLNVHNNLNRPTNYVTHMYMFYGQLLDHDITQVPTSTSANNQIINCCKASNENHPQCASILVRPDDPFYSQFGMTCITFVRSVACPTCALGKRQQINQITAFIDASFVYGNNLNVTQTLRANDGTGKLRFQTTASGILPPYDPEDTVCSVFNLSSICFQTGDSRANQHTTLMSLQTLFLREHNRLAVILKNINPHWGEERLFQETRRIVGAEMQAITYKEYLPITLGPDKMSDFSLWTTDGGTTVYDDTANPTLHTEFSTAAFRFGHSLVNTILADSIRGENGDPMLFRDTFFDMPVMMNGIMGPLLEGVSESSAQCFDRHLVPDVTEFLYKPPTVSFGVDLAAINIQRGRDHGLPTYSEMVRYCSQKAITINRFSDLESNLIMTKYNMQLLKRNYKSVSDIDLWTGILNEIPNDGSVVGPTGACIIGMQFQRLKFGDRFYFENRGQPGSFTKRQIQELRKTTLSQIICMNTDVTEMSLNAMLFRSQKNPSIQCRDMEDFNFNYWKEKK